MTNKFKQGDQIQGSGKYKNYKGRVISIIEGRYKIFWIGTDADQFGLYAISFIDAFYERAES